MKFIDLNKNLKDILASIYVVSGEDSFLISQTINTFKKQVVTDFPDLNYNYFDDNNTNIIQVLNACNGLPFMIEKKLVVAKIEALAKNDFELLKEYANNPNPATVFLLVSQNKDFLKLSNTTEIDCSWLDNETLLKLIASRLKAHDKTITRTAAQALIKKCDNDAMKIVGELEKLRFYTSQALITEEDVAIVVPDSFEFNIFNLTNALSAKNADTTLKILKDMLSAKTEPTQIISAIAGNFRRMFLSVITTNLTNEQIAQELKVKPYAILKAKETAAKFSVKNLKRIHELLQEVDFKLKNGKMSAENCVYYLVFNILTV